MRFPDELWEDEKERQIVRQFADAFATHPLVLTDKLANTIYFNPSAEALFQDDAEAIVNRLSFSLLGYGLKDKIPAALTQALLGEGVPWRGIVNISTGENPLLYFIEASAIRQPHRFLCGAIRFNTKQGANE